MRITMKRLWSSPAGTYSPGDVVDLPRQVAEELIAGRAAVRTKDDPAKAKAPAPAPNVDEADEAPVPSAPKKTWVAWVVAEYGVDETVAQGLTRRDLIAIHEAGVLPDEDEDDGDEGQDPDVDEDDDEDVDEDGQD